MEAAVKLCLKELSFSLSHFRRLVPHDSSFLCAFFILETLLKGVFNPKQAYDIRTDLFFSVVIIYLKIVTVLR